MRFVSYNIQYGTGKDGRVDLGRIAAEVGEAEVVALQEVERFCRHSGEVDQPAALAELFPEHHWVYGPGLDLDASFLDAEGRLVKRRRQFGNMLLSRRTIVSSRNHLLPKLGLVEALSLQRSALEAVIETASGPLRVYSVHLAHAAASERLLQAARLLEIVRRAPAEGGAWSGRKVKAGWTEGRAPPPMPPAAVLLGDFNCRPDSEEYALLCGPEDPRYGRETRLDGLVDGWIAAGMDPAAGPTCDDDGRSVRIDYAFVTAELIDRVRAMAVDSDALGSDHQPISIELDL